MWDLKNKTKEVYVSIGREIDMPIDEFIEKIKNESKNITNPRIECYGDTYGHECWVEVRIKGTIPMTEKEIKEARLQEIRRREAERQIHFATYQRLKKLFEEEYED